MTHFGLTGLATMGASLARNVASHDIPVAVQNRTTEKTNAFMRAHGDEGPLTGHETVEEWVGALERPRVLMTMVKAGDAVDAVIEEFAPHLDAGDVILDGNSHFRDTQRRARWLAIASTGRSSRRVRPDRDLPVWPIGVGPNRAAPSAHRP